MLLQMAFFRPSLGLSSTPLCMRTVLLLAICWRAFSLFPCLAIVNSAAVNLGVHISF